MLASSSRFPLGDAVRMKYFIDNIDKFVYPVGFNVNALARAVNFLVKRKNLMLNYDKGWIEGDNDDDEVEEEEEEEEEGDDSANKRRKLSLSIPSERDDLIIINKALEECKMMGLGGHSFKIYLYCRGNEYKETKMTVGFRGITFPIAGKGEVKEEDLRAIYNESVQKAKDITAEEITVSEDLLKELAEQWKKYGMFPSDVTVKPYKINFYEQGGKFLPRVDTPSLGFVGTIVLSLYNSSDGGVNVMQKNGRFEHHNLKVKYSDAKYEWDSYFNECVGFYGDVVHETTVITDNGFRVTLTCNVYHNNQGLVGSEGGKIMTEILRPILSKYRHIGFLTGYKYPREESSTNMKGIDSFISQALAELLPNGGYRVCNVVEKLHISGYNIFGVDCDGGKDTYQSRVYILEDGDLSQNMPTSSSSKAKKMDPIRFFQLASPLIWQNEINEGCHAGLESQEAEQNSIYISKAFIID